MLSRSLALTLAIVGVARAESTVIESTLTEAIATHPVDAKSMLRLGIYLQTQGRAAEGDTWIKAASAANPDAVTEFYNVGLRARGGPGCASTGADLTVAGIPQIAFMSHEGPAQAGVSAFGIAASVCNIGDLGVGWEGSTPNHPVAAQNIYRYADGRFSHIGMSWLKHEFFALATNLCCTCPGFVTNELAAGCSDSFSAAVAANQSILGPRSEVNPATGEFPYPFTSYAIGSASDRRCQVADADINPSLNPGATYFAEVHYVTPTDAAAGNGNNNAAFREVVFNQSGEGFSALFAAPAVPNIPAIIAWPTVDPNAVVIDVDIPSDGRFHVGYAVTDNTDGTWHYEYAVHNMNSDRAAQAFSVPIPAGVTLSNVEFQDVTYHSGDPVDTTDWLFTNSGNLATWSTETFDTNPNANALRWGTLYNFAFDADAPPVDADAVLTLFKPATVRGAANTASAPTQGPAAANCPADFDGNGTVDSSDLAVLLAAWGAGGPADFNSSGTVDSSDLAVLLAAWGACQ